MKRSLLILAVFLLGICVGPQQAQAQVKVGYINPQLVLAELPEREAIERQLTSLIERLEGELAQAEEGFISELEMLQQRVEAGTATMQQLEAQRDAFREEITELFRSQQMQVQRRQQDLLRPVLMSIDEAIAEVATEMGLSYVLNEMTSDGEMILLFISGDGQNTLNITDRVLQKLK
ncbi:MAG: OmpH family outer membrane protein [Bacteroidetes bacterium]|nr:OmpH family outer membrane protein [Bacteroidota bacterium]MCH8524164.1 OmpH family outer membrane protein [Balneolales bacterium]